MLCFQMIRELKEEVSRLRDLLIREGYNIEDITGRDSIIFIIMANRSAEVLEVITNYVVRSISLKNRN